MVDAYNKILINYQMPLNTMLLYHFLNAKYGLDAIKNRRIKVSNIMDLNDPFEFLGVDLSNEKFREALKKTKKGLSEEAGIVSFSKTWQNPVLWGHYADRHKGICLEFEVPEQICDRVSYVDSRFPCPKLCDIDKEFMKKLYHTKFSHWQYEEEYRIFASLTKETNGLYYVEFQDVKLTLTRVIVGCNSSISRQQVSDSLDGFVDDVQAFKARESFRSFEIVKNQNRSLWI